jgi:hypothetical protein
VDALSLEYDNQFLEQSQNFDTPCAYSQSVTLQFVHQHHIDEKKEWECSEDNPISDLLL